VTNRTLNSLHARLDALENNIAREHELFREKQEKLQKSYEGLARELSELKGGTDRVNLVLTLLSIGLVLMIALGGLNLIRYQRFEVVKHDVYDILGDVFQRELADTIDQLIMVSPPPEQQRMANRIQLAKEQLAIVGVDSEEFKRQSSLATALDLVLTNKPDEALAHIELVIQRSGEDSFVQARALALKAYVTILKDGRVCRDPKSLVDLLKRALEKDSRIAIAYNALALCREAEALNARDQSVKDWGKFSSKMQESINYYQTAFELKPTAQSKFRFVNNQVWAHCELYEANRKYGYPDREFLKQTRYTDAESFFAGSLSQLDLAQSLSSKNPAWRETKAELLALKSTYGTENLWLEAKTLYLEAIQFGLFDKFATCQEALNYFIGDSLLGKLRCDKEIWAAIERKYSAGECIQTHKIDKTLLINLCKEYKCSTLCDRA